MKLPTYQDFRTLQCKQPNFKINWEINFEILSVLVSIESTYGLFASELLEYINSNRKKNEKDKKIGRGTFWEHLSYLESNGFVTRKPKKENKKGKKGKHPKFFITKEGVVERNRLNDEWRLRLEQPKDILPFSYRDATIDLCAGSVWQTSSGTKIIIDIPKNIGQIQNKLEDSDTLAKIIESAKNARILQDSTKRK